MSVSKKSVQDSWKEQEIKVHKAYWQELFGFAAKAIVSLGFILFCMVFIFQYLNINIEKYELLGAGIVITVVLLVTAFGVRRIHTKHYKK